MTEKEHISIRICSEEDLPILREFYRRLFEDYGDPVPSEGVDGRLSEYALIAEWDGKPIGYIIGEHQTIEFMESEIGRAAFPGKEYYLEIQDLYVLPEYQNRTIGTRLVQEVLKCGRRNGLERSMVYSSNPDYIRTARFYEQCGFKMWHIFMTQ